MDRFPVGHKLPEGAVVDYTLTSYKVRTPEGETVFVPFAKVHPLVPAAPLVTFR